MLCSVEATLSAFENSIDLRALHPREPFQKFLHRSATFDVFEEREEVEAIVRIRDSGIGIAPEVLPHVFDLFVQADPLSRRADAGLGIGLALVRSLVERHGGRVTVVSADPGHGSEFTVRLPMP